MSELDIIDYEYEQPVESEALTELKKSVDLNPESTIICESKAYNPNFLSIIHSNEKFCDSFNIANFNLFGQSYDFLFRLYI